jgi:hypothetical protein
MSPPEANTRVYDEAYFSYVEDVNPRRTPLIGKRAISGWKLDCYSVLLFNKLQVAHCIFIFYLAVIVIVEFDF